VSDEVDPHSRESPLLCRGRIAQPHRSTSGYRPRGKSAHAGRRFRPILQNRVMSSEQSITPELREWIIAQAKAGHKP
jgi:hypothetical protein